MRVAAVRRPPDAAAQTRGSHGAIGQAERVDRVARECVRDLDLERTAADAHVATAVDDEVTRARQAVRNGIGREPFPDPAAVDVNAGRTPDDALFVVDRYEPPVGFRRR